MIPGLGGMGKSRLARAYVEEALTHGAYDAILWFQLNRDVDEAQNKSSLETQYREWFCSIKEDIKEDSSENALFNLFKNRISQHYKRPLIIYDDVTSGDFMRGLLPQTNAHILITSRDSLGWKPVEMILALEGFQAEESVKFLCQESGRNVEDEKEDVLKVANALGHLPLALEQAASWVRVKKKPFAKYLEEFSTKAIELMTYKARGSDYPHVVATTWAVTMNSVSKLARKLMGYFAYLRSEDIPLSLFESLDPEDAIDELVQYSMIKRKDDSVSLHQLVQLVTRNDYDKEKTIQELLISWASYWQARVTTKVESLQEKELYAEYKLFTVWQEHCQDLKSHLQKPDVINEKSSATSSSSSSVRSHQPLTRIAEFKIYLLILEKNISTRARFCLRKFFSLPGVVLRVTSKDGKESSDGADVVKEKFVRDLQKTKLPHTLDDSIIGERVFNILKTVSRQGGNIIENFIDELKKIKTEDLNNFLIEGSEIASIPMKGSMLLNIIKYWCSVPREKRCAVPDLINEIIHTLTVEYQKRELDTSGKEKTFPIGQQEGLLRVIFQELTSLEVEEQRELFYQVKTFLEDLDMSQNIWEITLKMFKAIKREERDEIIKLLKPHIFLFFPKRDMQSFYARPKAIVFQLLINKLVALSINERAKFMERLGKHVVSTQSEFEIIYSLNLLSKFDEQGMQYIKGVLIEKTDSEEEKQEASSSSHTLPVDLREKLKLDNITEDEESDLKNAIKKISSDEEKKEIIAIVGQIKTSNMDGFDCAELLAAISKIDADQRKLVPVESAPFKQEGMSGEGFAVVIESLFRIQEPLKRKAVARSVLEITADKNMGASQIETIIDTLSNIEKSKWPFIVKYATEILTSEMEQIECKNIIEELSDVSEEEIEILLKYVQSLSSFIKPDQYSFSYLFHDVKVLKDRDNIISLLFEIFEDEKVSIYEVTRTMDELKYLKEEQRHRVVFIIKAMKERLLQDTPLFLLMHSLPTDELVKLIMKEV